MAMVTEAMLTTTDNPYDPFTSYTEWNAFDSLKGYHTAELLARIAITSHELSESDQRHAIEVAIDEIVAENVTGMHKKVTREVPEDEPADIEGLDEDL